MPRHAQRRLPSRSLSRDSLPAVPELALAQRGVARPCLPRRGQAPRGPAYPAMPRQSAISRSCPSLACHAYRRPSYRRASVPRLRHRSLPLLAIGFHASPALPRHTASTPVGSQPAVPHQLAAGPRLTTTAIPFASEPFQALPAAPRRVLASPSPASPAQALDALLFRATPATPLLTSPSATAHACQATPFQAPSCAT